ncbi:MAG: hypothetical protein ACOCTR_04910 [Candidatus Natronoplasma sp.]
MKKIFIRNVEKKETVAVELDSEVTAGALVEELKRFWSGKKNFSLHHRGIELAEDKALDSYGLEEYDLLSFVSEDISELRSDLAEDEKSVLSSKRWLEENIGVKGSEIELFRFSRADDDTRDVRFEEVGEKGLFKLTISDGKVVNYDYGEREEMDEEKI